MVTDLWVLSDALSGMGLEKVALIQSKGQGLRKQATVGLAPGHPFFSGKVPAFKKLQMKVSFPSGPLERGVFKLQASQALLRVRTMLTLLVRILWLKAIQKSVQ